MQTNNLNSATITFIEELKKRPDVLGVIMFGSWARGNNREDSDVDLVVILKEGFRRTVEYRDGQAFEIIYTTPKSVVDFWEGHKDGCYDLWKVAKILFDRDGTMLGLKQKAMSIIEGGKKEIDPYQIGQYRFSMEDEIRSAERLFEKDPTTANLLLYKTVLFLMELFFNLKKLWTPAPKQILGEIKIKNPELYSLLNEFFVGNISFQKKIDLVKKIIPMIFEN